MKKVKLILISIAVGIVSMLLGHFMVKLFNYAGANMITVKDIVGCYFFSGLFCVVSVFFISQKPRKKH